MLSTLITIFFVYKFLDEICNCLDCQAEGQDNLSADVQVMQREISMLKSNR